MKHKLIQLFVRQIKAELCIYKVRGIKKKPLYDIISETIISEISWINLPDNHMEDKIRIIDNNFSNIKYYK